MCNIFGSSVPNALKAKEDFVIFRKVGIISDNDLKKMGANFDNFKCMSKTSLKHRWTLISWDENRNQRGLHA